MIKGTEKIEPKENEIKSRVLVREVQKKEETKKVIKSKESGLKQQKLLVLQNLQKQKQILAQQQKVKQVVKPTKIKRSTRSRFKIRPQTKSFLAALGIFIIMILAFLFASSVMSNDIEVSSVKDLLFTKNRIALIKSWDKTVLGKYEGQFYVSQVTDILLKVEFKKDGMWHVWYICESCELSIEEIIPDIIIEGEENEEKE